MEKQKTIPKEKIATWLEAALLDIVRARTLLLKKSTTSADINEAVSKLDDMVEQRRKVKEEYNI